MKRFTIQIFTLLLLITLAVPAFAGKVLAEIEYFYSDDGTLTGKAFNGKRVNFEYDLRGQLLAVKDAQGKDLERYTYDPAGNRLSKTINGVTTTYTYDKANQLATSTVNGKTTHYKYDAAGRMIQAGDKTYIYNGQNKVSEVRQNGKTIAKFEYNIDGQIAKAIYGDKVEEFMWDGLALIWRSGVTYINEPYVTGGNPVMAGDDVLFNDMLGSTLAVNGNPVEMTSFGETGDKNAFFTGKPMIDELGYSFLFRDYNPNQGKWTTTDPLGYPDGWNNLAYVNNGTNSLIDWLGAVALFASSKHSFNASPVWLIDYIPPMAYDNVQLRGNDLVRYEITATADGNNSGITGISVQLSILSAQTFGFIYTKEGKGVWSPTNIIGSAVLSSHSTAQTVKNLANGDKEYSVEITVYVYEKASGANHQSSAPIKTYSLTLKHVVKE